MPQHTEDRTLTETIENALIVRGFGPKTAHDAAGIAAAAAHFHAENDHRPYTGPEDLLVGTLPAADGIDQGVSRLTLLSLLTGDRGDDERIEQAATGITFPYRGHRITISYQQKERANDLPFAKVKLLHSLATSGARYAEWLVVVSLNVAQVVPTMHEIDTIIDAERAEVFA